MTVFGYSSWVRTRSLPKWLKTGLSKNTFQKNVLDNQKIALFSLLADKTRAVTKNGLHFCIIPRFLIENFLVKNSFKARLFQCLSREITTKRSGFKALHQLSNHGYPSGCIGWTDLDFYYVLGERKLTLALENPSKANLSILSEEEAKELKKWFQVTLNFAGTKLKHNKIKRIAVFNPDKETRQLLKQNNYVETLLELKDFSKQIETKKCWVKK